MHQHIKTNSNHSNTENNTQHKKKLNSLVVSANNHLYSRTCDSGKPVLRDLNTQPYRGRSDATKPRTEGIINSGSQFFMHLVETFVARMSQKTYTS